ncbi:acyltransferase family protein [Spirosoma taeanense]|uniref:Acyltransferase family protein n=1 Tax=Spirosoma taeanense TaxID=2735870 RepID=A0A6M5Y6A7_9BACT|nr:acyltransferase family protein [Spirosoma taeanense]QJW88880.1 acyltransferase family protein [Spirosoma taeanense]
MTSARYNGLDVLRIGMMFSVMVTHAGLSYTNEAFPVWGEFHDPQTNHIAFYYVFLIRHLFSMPVFFVLAGFFGAMTVRRYGAGAMLRNRTRRILLPLLVFMPLLSPIILLGFAAARNGTTDSAEYRLVINMITSGVPVVRLVHLWFLYYLYIFCLLAYVTVKIAERLPAHWVTAVTSRFDRLLISRWYALIFGVVTLMTLLTMHGPWIETPTEFRLNWRTFLVEIVFFVFGWRLFHHSYLLNRFTQRPWLNVGASALFMTLYLTIYFHRPWFSSDRTYTTAAMVMGACHIWTVIPGLIGLSLKAFPKSTLTTQLLSQGSYWMYLAHMPLTIWISYWLLDWPVSCFLKFGVNLVSIFLFTFLTYLLFVRSTFIGRFLNGKAHPWIFARKPAPAAPAESIA